MKKQVEDSGAVVFARGVDAAAVDVVGPAVVDNIVGVATVVVRANVGIGDCGVVVVSRSVDAAAIDVVDSAVADNLVGVVVGVGTVARANSVGVDGCGAVAGTSGVGAAAVDVVDPAVAEVVIDAGTVGVVNADVPHPIHQKPCQHDEHHAHSTPCDQKEVWYCFLARGCTTNSPESTSKGCSDHEPDRTDSASAIDRFDIFPKARPAIAPALLVRPP